VPIEDPARREAADGRAGRRRWLSQGQRPADGGTYPVAGSHFAFTAKTITSTIPIQKTGRVIAVEEIALMPRSRKPPRRVPATMPAGMPITSAMRSATPVTERSTGSPVLMLVETGTPENQEVPRSPLIALPIQLKYWAKKPRSRPIA